MKVHENGSPSRSVASRKPRDQSQHSEARINLYIPTEFPGAFKGQVLGRQREVQAGCIGHLNHDLENDAAFSQP